LQALPTRAKQPNTPTLVVQITDLHLMERHNGILRQTNPDDSLRAVLDLIQANDSPPDVLLATGDLTQDGSVRAYQRLLHTLGERAWPVRCLPGNHDNPRTLKAILGDWTVPVTDVGAWRIIALDSTVAGTNAGHISHEQLEFLSQAAASAGDRYILIALHHNPFHEHEGFTDSMMLDNPHILFQRLNRIPKAKVVLWGHVHHALDKRRQRLRLLATPSTCFQFTVRDGRHAVDDVPPGYRWLKLYDDGSISTGVHRLAADKWAAMKRTYDLTTHEETTVM